jgi:phosphoribosylformylglycinamidine synthase subunit PurQ / glutaminase
MSVRVSILYVPGTNCHRETAATFRRVGGDPHWVLLEDLLRGSARLSDADVVCLPGGFAFGDHIGAGNVAAAFLTRRLGEQLKRCREKPMICICNGFQIAVRTGLFGPVSLVVNANGTFHDEPRQRHLVVEDNDSFWLDGLRGATLEFPCAHGEGRFIYERREGWRPALLYPAGANPDGSSDGIAGVTNPDGNILGVMDHPERARDAPLVDELFANAIRAARG